MPHRVVINPDAMQELADIQPAKVRRQISNRIDELEDNPRPRDCMLLRGLRGCYRIRQGLYRMIYRVDDVAQVVAILMIGHRRDVYNRFHRRR